MRGRREIYREILAAARRRRDAAGLRADRAAETVEEQHLRLIPPLLNSNDERRHRHYLDVERPRYQRAFRRGDGADEFLPLWRELEGIASVHRPQVEAEPPFAVPAAPLQLDYRSSATPAPADS